MYIYILTKNDRPFYVGKTTKPKSRLSKHKRKYGKSINLKVIDISYEMDAIYLEYHYMNYLLKRGVKLKNKSLGICHKDKCSTLLGKLNTKLNEVLIHKVKKPKRNEEKFKKFLVKFEIFISSKQ